MTKKILTLSVILVALTIGGIAMASQPTKPIKQDTQPTTINTESQTIGADSINPVAPATPVTKEPATVTAPEPVVKSSEGSPLLLDTAPPDTENVLPSQPSSPVDITQPGTHNQTSQIINL
jgi:hypothetical protein